MFDEVVPRPTLPLAWPQMAPVPFAQKARQPPPDIGFEFFKSGVRNDRHYEVIHDLKT